MLCFAVVPTCGNYATCADCAVVDDCAWCGSAMTCMTVSEIFSKDCKGTVFEPPCPASFVSGKPRAFQQPVELVSSVDILFFWEPAANRVTGNLVVQRDPVFGGGHLKASGIRLVRVGLPVTSMPIILFFFFFLSYGPIDLRLQDR